MIQRLNFWREKDYNRSFTRGTETENLTKKTRIFGIFTRKQKSNKPNFWMLKKAWLQNLIHDERII